MKTLLWISDFFLEDEIIGGAEIVDNIYKKALSDEYEVKKINSHLLTSSHLEEADILIVSNFTNLSEEGINKIIQHKNYFIMEHDHKYLITRDPSPFRNHQAPPRYVCNKDFYKKSKAIFCQSRGHENSIRSNLFTYNTVNLETSIWNDDQYDHILNQASNKKTNKYAILNSENQVKNTNLAVNYCKSNSIDYDLISDNDWEKFISKLSKYEGLVFFPRVYESHCRLVVEARMLGLKILTNENIGATSESWFSEYKGKNLIKFLKNRKNDCIQKLKNVISGEHKLETQDKPLVSIITSMYKGEAHVKQFLENMVNQTYFENCELILLNANSPENEDQIIEPYLSKHKNIYYEKLDKDPGIYGTWNLALEKSKGKYITNANLDDRRANNQIEELVKALEFNPENSLAYTECFVTQKDGEDFYNNSSKNTVYPAPEFSPESMIKCLPGCMPLWKREIHEKCGLFNHKYKMAGDWEMWLRAVKSGYTFMKIDEPLGLYYFNPKGLSTSKDTKQASERYQEEKDVFWKYTEVFGKQNTEHYREYFSR